MAIRAGSSVSEEKQREGKRRRRRTEKVKCMFGLRENVRIFVGWWEILDLFQLLLSGLCWVFEVLK